MRLTTHALTVLLLALPLAQAQVVELVPEAKTMAAPDWAKPGARITVYKADSTRTDTGMTTDSLTDTRQVMGATGGAGHGYAEITIVASEPGLLACESRQYLIHEPNQSGPTSLMSVTGRVTTTPGAVEDLWLHPDALKALLERPVGEGSFSWSRVKDTIAGQERDAVQVETEDRESSFVWVYDLETGLLLRSGKRVGTQTSKSLSLASTEFRSLEQLDLPWLGAAPPDWVARTKIIEFAGQYQAVTRGLGTMPSVPMAQRFERKKAGEGWALYELTHGAGTLAALASGSVERTTKAFVSGGGSPSSLWVSPSVLAELRQGQELFSSSVTGFRTSVLYVGLDQGQDVCVIRWESPLQIWDYVYERASGGLVRIFLHDKGHDTQLHYQLAGTR